MPQFIFVYVGGDYPTDPAEGQKHFEDYQGWLNSLGDAVISPAIPFKDTTTVHPDKTSQEGTTTAMSGMSLFQFSSQEEALAAAKTCPFLDINGTLEVSEMLEMSQTVN